jgi:hypothetical protein
MQEHGAGWGSHKPLPLEFLMKDEHCRILGFCQLFLHLLLNE